MIIKTKKYKDSNGTEFYGVVYLNSNLDINRVYMNYCINLKDVNFNKPFASYNLNRLNTIDLDYLTGNFIESSDIGYVIKLMS